MFHELLLGESVCGCEKYVGASVCGQDCYWDYLHQLHMDARHAKLKCGGVWQFKICLLSEADSCIQQNPLVSGPLGSVEIAAELSFSMGLFLYLGLRLTPKF